MTSPDTLETILSMCDSGATVDAMCEASGLRFSRVYGILREHRPNRPRQRRKRTSDIPHKVRVLHDQGIPPPRIAVLLEVTRSYVYQILVDSKP